MVNNDIHYIRKEVDNLQTKMSEFNVRTEYAQNQSDTNPPTTGWSEIRPSSAEGYFIWVRNIMNMGYGDVISEPYCVGDGLEHITGLDVEYISWADPYEKPPHSANGWQTTAPSLTWGHYIWSRTKIITTEQITYTDPVRITGDASEEIAVGNGYPSDNKYVHVVYSDVNNPQDWNQCFRYPANHKYVGVVVTNDEGYVTIPSMYSWSEYNPTKGYSVGNGKYFHIKYSNNENGVDANNNADMNDKGGLFIGYCTNTSINDPNTPASYTWIRLEGKGILEIIEHYAESTHYDTAPTTGWSTSPPIFRAGYFYWTKSVIYYTDSTTYSTTPICVSGVDGTGVHYVYFCKDTMVTPSTPTWSDIHANSSTMSQNYGKWVEDPVPVTEDYPYIYISTSTDYDAVHDEWNHFSTPSLWSKWGADGEDGEGFEIVFYRASDVLNWDNSSNNYRNPYKLSSSVISSAEYQTADYIPFKGQTYAWSDDAQGVDADTPFEYACTRTKNNEGVWSAFSKPFMWSKYGNDGKDGKGFEIVFYQTNDLIDWTNSSNDYRNPTKISTSASGFQEEDYVPWQNDSNVNKRWTDDAVGISSNKAYEYASTRTKGENGLWSAFTKPFLWANYSTSIKDVTNYYLATSYSANVGTSDGAWGTWSTDPTSTNATITSTKKYLWNYEVVIDENNDVINTTAPCIIGRYGDTGGAGKGISSIVEHYAVSSTLYTPNSWVSPPWTSSNPMPTTDGTNKYLWNYETINWTSGSPTDTGKRVISVHGEKGERGVDGKGLEYIFYRTNTEVSNWASNDNLYNDKATSNTTSRYYLSNCTLSFDTNKLVMTRTSTDGCYLDYRILDSATLLAKYLGKTIRFECDIESATAECYIRIGQIVDGEASYSSSSTRVTNGHLSVDYTIDANATAVMFRLFGALLDVGGTCSFRNFKISSFTNPTKWSTTGDFQNDDYVKPNTGWSDDAQGVDKNHIYEYCAIRTKTPNASGVGVWGAFNSPTLWAIYTSPIEDVINYYLATSSGSGVTTSTSGWTPTVQSMTSTKQYLWNYEVIKAVDGTTLNTTTPVIIGRWGQNGSNGRGISEVTEHYAVNNSTTAPSSGWVSPPWTSSNPIPTTSESNRYLWNYETLTYVDGTPATEDTAKRIISVHGQRGSDGITPDTSTIVDEVGDAIQRKDIVLNDVDAITLEGKSADAFMSVTPLLATIQQEGVGSGTVECRKFGQLVVVNINQCTVNNTSSSQTGWEAMRKTNSSYLVIPSEYQPSTDMIVGAGTNSANSNDAQLRIINASHDTNAGKIFFKRSGYISATNYGEIVSATFVYFRDSRTATNITATNSYNTMYPADSITFTLKSGNTALANKTINIKINDVNYPKTTDANGKATIKLNLPAKLTGDAYDYHNYNYTVRFNGDETYAPSSNSGTVRLNYAPAQITHTLPSTNDGQKIIIGRNTPFTGAVKNPNGQGIRGIEVTVSIIGKTFKGKTDNDGNFNIYHPNDGQTYDNPNSSTTTDFIVNANLFTKKNQLRIDPYPNYYGN